jgi:DNA polymerase III psi subunit
MTMLKSLNKSFLDILFAEKKIIISKNGNQKNISEQLLTISTLVFVPGYNNQEEEEVQLHKILKACTLQPGDYAIITGENVWLDFRELEQVKNVLLFGTQEDTLGIMVKMPMNIVVSFDNRSWIKTYPISNLMRNQQAKNELWQQALKPHFT